MKLLLENWQSFLNEAENSYNMTIEVVSDKDTQLYGSIYNKIRALTGITIVKAAQSSSINAQGNKTSQLDIKFLINPAQGITYIDTIKHAIKRMKDDQGDRILSVRITQMPQRTDI